MTKPPDFSFYVDGDGRDGLVPSAVDIGELAIVLSALERALAKSEPEAEGKRPKKIHVSLTSIKEGSVDLGLSSPDQSAIRQFEVIGKAAALDVYDSLTETARNALEEIRAVLAKWRGKGTFRIFNPDGSHRDVGTIRSMASIFPAPIEVEGETEVVGIVYDVGGVEPNVHVAFIGQLKKVKCFLPAHDKINEARKIGSEIYGQFRIKGRATWDSRTGEIIRFTIDKSEPFHDVSPESSFSYLREAYGNKFDEIADVDDYIAKLREDS